MKDLNWNNLSHSKRENSGFVLHDDQRLREFIFATKFLTSCFLSMEAMARTFKQLWGSINSFKICHLGDHKVLFVFDNLPDVDRII